jgi:hypothetical protein
VAVISDAINKVISFAPDAKTTPFGGTYFFINPKFTTSSKQFKWIETALFVGQGHFVVDSEGNAVEYLIYQVVN